MAIRRAWLLPLLFAAACADRAAEAPPAVAAPPPAVEPAPAPAPAAGAPGEPTIAAGAAAPLGVHDRALVHFRGYGAAAFGADEAAVRTAWDRPLQPQTLAGTKLCYYLEMEPRPAAGAAEAVAFMFEDGVFKRFEVDGTVPAAPGGFTVGARAQDIVAAFGSRVTVQPHKYLSGAQYLVVRPEFAEPGLLVFETDEQGRVKQWRIGLEPQVQYVEGCG